MIDNQIEAKVRVGAWLAKYRKRIDLTQAKFDIREVGQNNISVRVTLLEGNETILYRFKVDLRTEVGVYLLEVN